MIDHHGNSYYISPDSLKASWREQAARIADLELRNMALEELVQRMTNRADWEELVDLKMDNTRWRLAMAKVEDTLRRALGE